MAVQQEKFKRVARWERRQKHGQDDRRARQLLQDRKRERKAQRGANAIAQMSSKALTNAGYRAAVAELWDATRATKLVQAARCARPGGVREENTYLHGLSQLALRHQSWLRSPQTWTTRTHNADRQFVSLARHLLCRYNPPACFESAWFNTNPRRARLEQSWYVGLGLGQNLRGARGLPFELSRRAAHLLNEVPAQLTIPQAFRWAQLRAMDLRPALIEALLATTMGTDFGRDAFWVGVARFLRDQPFLDMVQVGPIVDYLDDQRHRDQPTILVDGVLINPGPAQPNLSMKGRTVDTLLCQVRQWHAQLGRGMWRHVQRTWRPSGVRGLDRVEGKGANAVLWRVEELRDSRELMAEGRVMRHCVGSYGESCARGLTAIFTMTRTQGGDHKKCITIEVRMQTRQVVQARGRCNAAASAEHLRVLKLWAQHAKLDVAAWL